MDWITIEDLQTLTSTRLHLVDGDGPEVWDECLNNLNALLGHGVVRGASLEAPTVVAYRVTDEDELLATAVSL